MWGAGIINLNNGNHYFKNNKITAYKCQPKGCGLLKPGNHFFSLSIIWLETV